MHRLRSAADAQKEKKIKILCNYVKRFQDLFSDLLYDFSYEE